MHAIDLLGQKFHRWTVLARAPNIPQGQAQWLCRCECGTERVLKSILIRRGISHSCGCWRRDNNIAVWTKHGHNKVGARSPTYETWASMIARCTNPKNKRFSDYGGRGIRVCKRWRRFEPFLADLGEKPPGHSIERIDNAKGYSPANCRWATFREQNHNRRNNHWITLRGETLCITDWAHRLGIARGTIRNRMKRMSVEEALKPRRLGRSQNSRYLP